MQHHKELEIQDKLCNLKPGGMLRCSKEELKQLACTINSPSHYNNGSIECIDAIEANLSKEEFIGYLRGNIKKYEWRCRYKGHMEEDLKKANWYLTKLLKVIINDKNIKA